MENKACLFFFLIREHWETSWRSITWVCIFASPPRWFISTSKFCFSFWSQGLLSLCRLTFFPWLLGVGSSTQLSEYHSPRCSGGLRGMRLCSHSGLMLKLWLTAKGFICHWVSLSNDMFHSNLLCTFVLRVLPVLWACFVGVDVYQSCRTQACTLA